MGNTKQNRDPNSLFERVASEMESQLKAGDFDPEYKAQVRSILNNERTKRQQQEQTADFMQGLMDEARAHEKAKATKKWWQFWK